MKFGSLFAGIGGFDLGFESSGLTPAFHVEIDAQAQRVLAHHWPDVPRFQDVRKVGKKTLPKVDVICGGFPCQDLSVAGKRAGLKGGRSGLFWEMVRITDELQPELLVFENVPGLLSSDAGRDFGRVLRGLADIGYFGAWRVLDAQFFGVPQRRRRVFGVFARERAGVKRAAEILALTEGGGGDSTESKKTGEDIAGTLGGGTQSRGWNDDLDRCGAFVTHTHTQDLSRCLTAGGRFDGDTEDFVCFNPHRTLQKDGTVEEGFKPDRVTDALHGPTGNKEPLICGTLQAHSKKHGHAMATQQAAESGQLIDHTLRSEGHDASEDGTGRGVPMVVMQTVRRLTPVECCRLQGFPDTWLDLEPPLADSAKYRLLGNAVAVPVSGWIGRRINV